jgi:hypothetical protein
MVEFKDIPYRQWGSSQLLEPEKQSAYYRVMRVMADAINAGKSVDFSHAIVNPDPKYGAVYDTVSLTIQD